MLRNSAMRSVRNTFAKLPQARPSYNGAAIRIHTASLTCPSLSRRPQIPISRPQSTVISMLYATKSGPAYDKINLEEEKKLAETPISPHPESVSTESSVRHVFEKGQGLKEDGEMLAGLKSDVRTIKETFALRDVPEESLYLGIAGVLPYAATSLSTVYLAYDINHAAAGTGHGILFSQETAHYLLDLVTPIQIGYGAVIISFLGAIHWGLEYAGYGGYHSYSRYMYGVIAPAIAWPTIFMPVEYALITQFATFSFLYFADARATAKGWFPGWYMTYRFVLTFFVGASIVISLVGRGQIISEGKSGLKNPVDYLKGDRDSQWEALALEEKERTSRIAKTEAEGAAKGKGEKEDEDNDKASKTDEGKDNKKGDNKDSKKAEDKESKKADDKDSKKADDKDSKKADDKDGKKK
ncbi:hypothetical protein BP5796_09037 [Coleophoma crateriformis]|uniref:MNN4-regulates the mannosylphosphorylation n=1 Tax=Coleophoma crateriformis TaxID=565419 RepID=A0A3D8R353_9HELO|nr:hypothetical protein BP5796_09037 [Coleophoma crateriformis]